MESIALALANASWLEDGTTPQRLAAWWGGLQSASGSADAGATSKPRFDSGLLDQARLLRAAVRELLLARARRRPAAPEALDRLNAVLRRSRMEASFREGGLEIRFVSDEGADAVLAPLAHSALHVLRASSGRMRECASNGCGALFADTTKNRSRRWCSLSCMERARAPRRKAARNRPQ